MVPKSAHVDRGEGGTMARLATVVLLALLLLLLITAAAASAAPTPIIKDLTPNPLAVFTHVGEGDVTGVAAAPNGIGYACGYELIIDHGFDVCVRRVGAGAWTHYWDGAAHGADKAADVVYSSKGAVYAGGSYSTQAAHTGAVVLKYSTAGKRLWVRRWNGPSESYPAVQRVLLDAKGQVVVVGRAAVDGTGHIYAAKYTPSGKLLWARVSTKGYLSVAEDAVLDKAGNLYVAGHYEATGASGSDGIVVKYSPAGKLLWAKTYDSVGMYDAYRAVCLRPAGGVYVAGSSETDGDDYDGILVRYTAAGGAKTVVRVGTSDGAYTEFYDLVRATDGKLVVCGGYAVGAAASSFVVASYTAAGAENWYHAWVSTTGSSRAELLVARPNGAVAASGFWARQSGTGPQDVMTYVINNAGVRRARNQWAGPTAGEPWPQDMVTRGSSLWIAGTCDGTLSGQDGYAMRLVP
jgi:hypothetical protein